MRLSFQFYPGGDDRVSVWRTWTFKYSPQPASKNTRTTPPDLAAKQLDFFKHIVDFALPPDELVKEILNTDTSFPILQEACRYSHTRLMDVTCTIWGWDLAANEMVSDPENPLLTRHRIDTYRYQLESATATFPSPAAYPWLPSGMHRGQHVGDNAWIAGCKSPRKIMDEAMLCARERRLMEKVESNMCDLVEDYWEGKTPEAKAMVSLMQPLTEEQKRLRWGGRGGRGRGRGRGGFGRERGGRGAGRGRGDGERGGRGGMRGWS